MKQAIRTQSDDESIRAFWRAYMAWMTTAQTVQGRRTVRAIRPALRSGHVIRAVPASLVMQLENTSVAAV